MDIRCLRLKELFLMLSKVYIYLKQVSSQCAARSLGSHFFYLDDPRSRCTKI